MFSSEGCSTHMTSARIKWVCSIAVVISFAVFGSASYARYKKYFSNNNASQILSAPTYYLALSNGKCGEGETDVRGASNLPPTAIVDLLLEGFDEDGWIQYSDIVSVPVGQDGYFQAKIQHSKQLHLPRNLIITATFGTNYHKQPSKVIEAVGKRGENLDDVNNPQAQTVSGSNTIISAMGRSTCGPKS